MLRGFVKLVLVARDCRRRRSARCGRRPRRGSLAKTRAWIHRACRVAPLRRPLRARPCGLAVRVVDVVLHPASTASGQRRKRARLTVRVRVENRGTQDRHSRPTRVVRGGGENGDRPGRRRASSTDLGTLAPGETKSVTLRFEVAGATTTRADDRSTRAHTRRRSIAGGRRSKVGGPVDDAVAAHGIGGVMRRSRLPAGRRRY